MAKFGVSVAVTEESTEQRPDYEDLPGGVYRLEISAAEVKRKNEGTRDESAGFKCTYDVIDPDDFRGRKIFDFFNLLHPSAQAQEIGVRQFSQLRRAVGLGDVDAEMDEQDVIDEMRLVPFVATVGMGKPSKEKNADGTPAYPAKNVLKRLWYPDLDDGPPIGVTAGAAAAKPANDNRRPAANQNKPAPAAKAAGSKPWKK